MNQTQLLARCRLSAFLEDTATDWTDSILLQEMYDQLMALYERGITKSRQGYWKKTTIQLITQGVSQYRVPNRACTGGLERIQIAYDSTLDWQDLLEVTEDQAWVYELGTGRTDRVARFVMRGDQITLLPAPDGGNYALRLHYYLRPSRIVAAQSAATNGLITAVNTSARTITVSTVPNSIDTAGTQTAITSGSTPIDVVSPYGWHEVQLVSETQTLSGTTFTCTGTGDMSTIKVGDYVRAEDQTDWPAVPDDFHRSVADAAALKILGIRRLSNPDVEQDLSRALSLFGDMLKPRVQASAQAIVAPISMYRGTRRGWPVKYP